MTSCVKLRPGGSNHAGRQGFSYVEGVAKESVGSEAICMHLLTIPPGGRARAHKHATHEAAIFVLSGTTMMAWGPRLQHVMEVGAGGMLCILADMPHLPWKPGGEPVTAVIARTDPHERESVALPELKALVP